MARSYKFGIVRLAPEDSRGERINIGVVVVDEGGLDVRLTRRIEKVRAISAAIDYAMLKDLTQSLADIDRRIIDSGITDPPARIGFINRVGAISLSDLGEFVADGYIDYEERIESIMKAMVEPEPAQTKTRQKRSKLLTQMKKEFRRERVMAQKGEDLRSHRIVQQVEMEEGLIADLVLKNGAFHVVETIDASSEDESPRRALGEIGISALVLERARMRYGGDTRTRVVYSATSSLERIARPSLEAVRHQGAEIINWSSFDERNKFMNEILSLAEPIPLKNKKGKKMPNQLRFM